MAALYEVVTPQHQPLVHHASQQGRGWETINNGDNTRGATLGAHPAGLVGILLLKLPLPAATGGGRRQLLPSKLVGLLLLACGLLSTAVQGLRGCAAGL